MPSSLIWVPSIVCSSSVVASPLIKFCADWYERYSALGRVEEVGGVGRDVRLGAGQVDVDMASLRGRGDAGGRMLPGATELCGDRLSLGVLAGGVEGGGDGVVGKGAKP